MADTTPDEPVFQGEIDTTYQTQQRDMFTSGLAATVGADAYIVWNAIKSHANYETGKCWPGVRRLIELTGVSNVTVQRAIKTLEAAHLLRVTRLGKKNIYIARERMDVRIGSRVICTIAVDYVPATMRERLAKLKQAALSGDMSDEDVWANVDVFPGPGMAYDASSGAFSGRLKADEVPALPTDVQAERERIRAMTDAMRLAPPKKRAL